MTREATKREKKNSEIRSRVNYYLTKQKCSKKDLANDLDISVASLYNKLKEPSKFTLGEIRDLVKIMRIDDPQILAELI